MLVAPPMFDERDEIDEIGEMLHPRAERSRATSFFRFVAIYR